MAPGYDRHLTVFSEDGRLFQLEYCIKAVGNQAGTTLGIAVRGKDSVAMVCQKKVPDKLMDPAYQTNMYMVTPKLGMMCIGSKPDAKSLVDEARRMAFSFQEKNGYHIPVHVMANKIGKYNQVKTQQAVSRLLAVTVHFAGCDDIDGSLQQGTDQIQKDSNGASIAKEARLYRVDPSGHQMGWRAVATGPKDQEAMTFLEKMQVKTAKGRGDELVTIRCAIDCLQKVLELEAKPSEIEVCVVNGSGYRILENQEVDEHLTYIHENEGEL